MSEEQEQSRRVRTMQDLLRFCVEGTVSEGVQSASIEIDPERKEWLQNAIKAFTIDIIQEMLEAIANIRTKLSQLNRDDYDDDGGNDANDDVIDSIEFSVDCLLERTGDLDIAADFEKIGGFDILGQLLETSHSQLQIKGAELVGELVQNHEYCQKAALSRGILEKLVNILNLESSKENLKAKALFATSCLVRTNQEAQDLFIDKLDGFSVLLKSMQSNTAEGQRLRTKASFLLSTIITDHPNLKETLLNMGFIEQIIALLHQELDQSHEHLLSTLLSFITDYPPALEECKKPQFKLKSLLQNRLVVVHDKPEFEEQESYCKSILRLLDCSTFSASDSNCDNMER